MEPLIFQPADILLPADADMQRWSVIACDQFTSDRDYWDAVERTVGGCPSTLRMMLPEIDLGTCDEQKAAHQIQETMREYLTRGVFSVVPHALILLERTLTSGLIRRGLIGMMDLEAYDFSVSGCAPVRATEHTVSSRLPPRVKVRADAVLEMPHIMVFFRDSEDRVMTCADKLADHLLYDFDLMLGGGHVKGRRISGTDADALSELLQSVVENDSLQYAVGDGNHSLAAAKELWNQKKKHLSSSEQLTHPSRFALVELVNIHDPAITFEPIHRVLFDVPASAFVKEAKEALLDTNGEKSITLLAEGEQILLPVIGASLGQVIEHVDSFCRAFINRYGGTLDYIHGDAETKSLSGAHRCSGIMLPYLNKDELFSSVEKTGPFPKKSFSIGLGPDKRYYLECRKLL